ncbi:hypothetical protein A3Q56_02414 [Intoshia linei]|uniref:Schlafen AlbA-2 domain-containing protein n=1 Tax=Intoshia linei TaxID=1819745 RepID=A0A177B668_9BILA|nr:hypothetical protein A3Q56_02414 [Intoshia linei]
MTKKVYKSGVDFYYEGSQLLLEENVKNEFKGHRYLKNYIKYEANMNDKSTRAPISKTICSILNRKTGGNIYIGVTDDGVVRGHHLTDDQRIHFLSELTNLCEKFTPNITTLIDCVFIPVLPKNVIQEVIDIECSSVDTLCKKYDQNTHFYERDKFCWCDTECMGMLSHSILPSCYVIVLKIKKSDPDQIYQNEEGIKCMRGLASNKTIHDI